MRRLLLEDTLVLKPDDRFLLLVPPGPLFESYRLRAASTSNMVEIRTTSVAGKVHLQFPSRLLSNPKGSNIASDVENGAVLIRQGEGITIRLF